MTTTDLAVVSCVGAAAALERLASHRDPIAWAWLAERFGPDIARMAGRLSEDAASADDARQEALLTIRDHAASFWVGRDAEQDVDQAAHRWILRVAANATLQWRRNRRRAQSRDQRSAGTQDMRGSSEVPSHGEALERRETAAILRDALAGLSEPERCAIILHVLGGVGFDQVAAELHCPVGTAKTRVHRGLERLRRRLHPRLRDLGLLSLLPLPSPEGMLASLTPMSADPGGAPRSGTHLDPTRRGGPPPTPISAGGSLTLPLTLAAVSMMLIVTPVLVHAASQDSASRPATGNTPAAPPAAPREAVTPLAVVALAPDGPEMRTRDVIWAMARGVSSYLAKHPILPESLQDLTRPVDEPPWVRPDILAADGILRDGFGEPVLLQVTNSPDHRMTLSVSIRSALGAPTQSGRSWGLRLNLDDGLWHEVGLRLPAWARPLAVAPAWVHSRLTAESTIHVGDVIPASIAVMLLAGDVPMGVDPALADRPVSLADRPGPLQSRLDEMATQCGGGVVWRDGRVEIVPLAPSTTPNPAQPCGTVP